MRMSDWSADVCSSDLEIEVKRDAGHDQPADRLDEADHRAARGGEREKGQPFVRLDVVTGTARIAADDRQRDARDRRQGEGERHPQPVIGIVARVEQAAGESVRRAVENAAGRQASSEQGAGGKGGVSRSETRWAL